MDGIIDIIIAILFIAVPAIFKAIGNRLEKSGSDKAGKFKKIAEQFEDYSIPEEEDVEIVGEEDVEPAPAVLEEPVVLKEPVVLEEVVRQTFKPVSKKPVIFVEDEPKKGEKIDPKKLVIYSEIMKPKF